MAETVTHIFNLIINGDTGVDVLPEENTEEFLDYVFQKFSDEMRDAALEVLLSGSWKRGQRRFGWSKHQAVLQEAQRTLHIGEIAVFHGLCKDKEKERREAFEAANGDSEIIESVPSEEVKTEEAAPGTLRVAA